jgi:predicted nucleotidyltransferase
MCAACGGIVAETWTRRNCQAAPALRGRLCPCSVGFYNSKRVTDDLEPLLARFFQADSHGAAAVYLFGSVARGTARRDSDVDIGVLFAVAPPPTLPSQPFGLEGDLERLLGRPVQVVVLNHAPADLRIRVLRDGRLLLDGDPSARIRFEVQTRNEAFDLAPTLREYRSPAETRR